eukprot:TRINITY_DN11939_c0_g1_i1.p1 TRINITY_DN11939_c0_g1~~TRINITY_DN11939_c0_g1_i1.p1  ORF type:complete len:117 (-),score=5.46 TRINITY_DN11939_c0_g1_i1:41-391(-)
MISQNDMNEMFKFFLQFIFFMIKFFFLKRIGKHMVITTTNKKLSGYVYSIDPILHNIILVNWIDENMKLLDQNRLGNKTLVFGKNIENITFSKNPVPCPLDLNKFERIEEFSNDII